MWDPSNVETTPEDDPRGDKPGSDDPDIDRVIWLIYIVIILLVLLLILLWRCCSRYKAPVVQ